MSLVPRRLEVSASSIEGFVSDLELSGVEFARVGVLGPAVPSASSGF